MGVPSPSDPLGLRPPPSSSKRRRVAYEIIFEHDSRPGRAFDVALILAILASVVAVMLESVTAVRAVHGPLLRSLEWGFTAAFSVEFLLRLWCVDRPVRYARSFLGIVDLMAVLPTYLSVLVPGGQVLAVVRILRVLRVFRILKLAQYTGEARVLGQALATVVMIMGYGIIAVPTGIVTAELAVASRVGREERMCPACGRPHHDPDALFCKWCGTSLAARRREPFPNNT